MSQPRSIGWTTPSPDVHVPPPDDGREPEAPEDLDDGQDDAAATRVKLRAEELRARLLNVDGLRTIPPPEPLVEGWLFANSLTWLAGKPGHAKTFVAVDLAACVASGRPWHGHDTTRGPVLYVIAEGASGLGQRVEAWALHTGTRVSELLFLPVPVNLADPLDVSATSALLQDLRPVLVVIDTQARVTIGLEENSSRDMGRFVEVLERLRRESGACLLVVHHEPRNGENLRGSTALEGAATTILRAVKDGQIVTVSNTKQKDAEQATNLPLALKDFAGSCILLPRGRGNRSSHDRLRERRLGNPVGIVWDKWRHQDRTERGRRAAQDHLLPEPKGPGQHGEGGRAGGGPR